ncbi:MAG: enoyl-CoA hydratase/isomerase family protein [Gammaproteobacteria bacterium]|nr:enoyl-CoA hydratase/isomerase family protein [Gammaproteobacteria bacterium]
MGLAEYEHLQVARDGAVATVTFNRPHKANALHHAHLAEIEAVALSFRDDGDTRAVIFTGAGKHFSSGADLTDGGGGPADPRLVMRRRSARIGERATLAVHEMDQITIAAWNGAAMGGGAVLATAMDFRIGADDCFMQYPEIDIGVNLMWKGLPLLLHLVGPARTKRLVAGGERAYANTLLEWGVIDDLVPRAELMDTAREWATRYAAKSPIAAQMIKQSVDALAGSMDRAVMHMDVDQNILSATTEDRAEAIRAYLAKAEPSFKGN